VAVVTHAGRAAAAEDQSMSVTLYDLREPSRPVRLASEPLPLSPGASLDWMGFSDAGALSTVDSAGVVRQCVRSAGFNWVPVLHCASVKKTKAEHHWVVGLTAAQLMCIICKGDDKFPATLPRPVMQVRQTDLVPSLHMNMYRYVCVCVYIRIYMPRPVMQVTQTELVPSLYMNICR